jgi:hypothetical protein
MDLELKYRLEKAMRTPIEPKLELFVHDDIDLIFNSGKIPLAFKTNAEVYIMQENRVVFIGTKISAMYKIINNRGEFLKSICRWLDDDSEMS